MFGWSFFDHGDEFSGTPGVTGQFEFEARGFVGEIESEDVDLAVVGKEFTHLAVEVVYVFGKILYGAFAGFVVTHGVVVITIGGVAGVVPIEERVVEPDLESFGAEGVYKFTDEVASGGSVGGFEVGEFGIEEAKSFVVFGREDSVFLAGGLCEASPGAGVKAGRIELVEVGLVIVVGDAFLALDPFASGGDGVEAPVDEHAEAVSAEPSETVGG